MYSGLLFVRVGSVCCVWKSCIHSCVLCAHDFSRTHNVHVSFFQCCYIHEKKHCHGGARQASDPWTVLFLTCYLSSAGNTHNLSGTHPALYTHTCTCMILYNITTHSLTNSSACSITHSQSLTACLHWLCDTLTDELILITVDSSVVVTHTLCYLTSLCSLGNRSCIHCSMNILQTLCAL